MADRLLALGAVELFRARNGNARDFHQAKRFVFAGAGCAFVVCFIGFLAVGGEWFAMWQSQVWDGQPAAFRFIASILLVLIFVAQRTTAVRFPSLMLIMRTEARAFVHKA